MTDVTDVNENHEPQASSEGPEAPEARPASPLRRLFRNRIALTVVVAGVVGALLGAGTVAWRTDTLPLLSPAPCWDSFDDGTMKVLFGDRETKVEEQVLQADPRGGLSYGQCRITGYKEDRASRQVTVRVHRLDGLRGTDARGWPEEFLAADMVALGDGLPGMASPSRAWLALPESCTGAVGEFEAATVVEVGMGRADLAVHTEYDHGDRAALTRAVVAATNGVLRDFECSGTYPTPERLPELVTKQDTKADPFCGVKGFVLPTAYREGLTWTRAGGDGGPARVCEAGYKSLDATVRLTTVVDPALVGVFVKDVLAGGTGIKGTKGYGSVNELRAVYGAECQTGQVIFMVEQKRAVGERGFALTRELLPAYVAAEAERIGCGPEKVTVPPSV